MLKVLGLFAAVCMVSLHLNASPLPVESQECQYSLEFSVKDLSIPQSTVDLILKESSKILKISYLDLCAAYDKDDLTITKMVTTLGKTAYEVQIGSCSLCILEDDIL